MNTWQRFKKWALAPTPTLGELVEDKAYDTMVGEPVISFLDSLKREPKRYKIEILTLAEYSQLTDKVYSWMGTDGFTYYRVTDKKLGDVYSAFGMSGSPLYRVDGLPFSLNNREIRAIWSAFVQLRTVARERKRRIEEARWKRRRDAEQKAERIVREEYAKKFQQEG